MTLGKFEVNLDDCPLDDYKVACVARELSKCSNDRHVNLEISVSRLTYEKEITFSSGALTELFCCCSVTSLNINGHYVEGEEFYYLLDAAATNSSLVKLALPRCFLEVTESSGPALTEMLKVNRTLQTLDMSFNGGLKDVGAFFIAEGLLHNSGLKHLDLRFICITAEGAKFITDALKVSMTLESLKLSRNLIGDTGFVYMAEALKSNSTLQRLELADCDLTENGLTVLSASLVVNNSLQYLDISTDPLYGIGLTISRPLDHKCLKHFVSCLKENLHLTELILGPARDAPHRSDIVKDESSALNQLRRDNYLPELNIICYCRYKDIILH